MRLNRNAALLSVSCLNVVHARDNSANAGNIISLAICALVIIGALYACYRGLNFFTEVSRHDQDDDRSSLTRPLV